MNEHSENEVVQDLLGTIRSFARCRKGEVLRYQLERDYGALVFPHKVKPSLIPLSRRAAKRIEQHGSQLKPTHASMVKVGLAYEHMVPVSVLGAMLVDGSGDVERVKQILQNYYQICWVTNEEDAELNKRGLRSRMPDGWKPGDPADARYRAADILF